MLTPLFRTLKEKDPDLFTGVLVHKRVVEVFKNNPFVDRVISFDTKNAYPKLSMISKIKKEDFDTALLLKASFTKSLLCKLSKIDQIIGPPSKKLTFINKALKHPSHSEHKMDNYLGLLEHLNIKLEKKNPEFFLDEAGRAQALEALKKLPKTRFTILLHPKANWELKMWPVSYFARLSDLLMEGLDAKVLITGSKDDLELASRIKDASRLKPSVLAGATSLGGLAGLIKEADLFISGDTGIMHLAASLKAPLIALFGATSPSFSGPRGEGPIKVIYNDKDCKMPCYKLDCRDNECMKAITPEEVFEAAKQILVS
jgi:lipopolysaccharide heptosyltransferase II